MRTSSRLRRFTASGTALPRSDDQVPGLRWTRRVAIRHRILAVNIFAVAILAGSLFYLDSFRSRLTEARLEQVTDEAVMTAHALTAARPESRLSLMRALGRDSATRLRIYDASGGLRVDSWAGGAPTYALRDPDAEPWYRGVALFLDNSFDAIVGARRPPKLEMPTVDRLEAWPEAARALESGAPETMARRAPDGTLYISAAVPIGADNGVLLLTENARDVRRVVRAERFSLILVLLVTIILSVLLSIFLARTIAQPLRKLALAAHRVRMGRSRDVDVPLLPARRDEIGLLARALHDMTHSLRNRIDATEAFAADVTHELKNPLASLRSAVDSLERVEVPEARQSLLDVIRADVRRLDRLIVDIAEASRLDAELSRARFEPADLGAMIETMLPAWEDRADRGVRLAFGRPRAGTAIVMGDESRLVSLLDNLVDNALSFSPDNGLVEIRAFDAGEGVTLSVEDEGPGVPPDARQAIFNRFHSIRADEDFGRHSGLGLAIAKAIVEGHDGTIHVEDRHDGRPGARFVVQFPGAQS
jgi:two-component system, OmpR family, sensor histidine kinase ChvG